MDSSTLPVVILSHVNPELQDALPEIVRRYAAGETIKAIALDYRKSYQTLYNWMFRGLGEDQYKDVLSRCHVNKICDADMEMDEASTHLDLTRAIAKAKLSRHDLERLHQTWYGQQRGTDVPTTIVVTVDR